MVDEKTRLLNIKTAEIALRKCIDIEKQK